MRKKTGLHSKGEGAAKPKGHLISRRIKGRKSGESNNKMGDK